MARKEFHECATQRCSDCGSELTVLEDRDSIKHIVCQDDSCDFSLCPADIGNPDEVGSWETPA